MPVLLACLLIGLFADAQCTIYARQYATTQHSYATGLLGASVQNGVNAVNGDLSDYSTLNGGVLGTATQFIQFGGAVSAGIPTPLTIKLSVPTGLLSLLGGVIIQPFTNLHQSGVIWQADAAGVATTDATLLNLLNGSGDQEITITPKNADGTYPAYTGVSVTLTGISIAQSIKVYEAYINQSTTASTACNTALDVLSGTRANTSLGALVNATSSVSNPRDAIDGDSINTYAKLDIGLQAFSEVYHTTVFGTPSQAGDTIKMVIRNSGSGLLDLGVASGFTVQLYNGATPVGSAITGSASFLSLTLFPDASDKYYLNISPPATDYSAYDRVEVQIGGVVALGLTKGLRIYDVKRVMATPKTSVNGGANAKTICAGDAVTLSIANQQDCTTYKWYDAQHGGSLLATADTYSPPATALVAGSTATFWVEAARTGCTEVTHRSPASVTVNPLPGITLGTNPAVCTGITTTLLPFS